MEINFSDSGLGVCDYFFRKSGRAKPGNGNRELFLARNL